MTRRLTEKSLLQKKGKGGFLSECEIVLIFSENNLMIKDFSFSIICKDNTFKICPLLF